MSITVDTTNFFNGFDIFDVLGFMELFGVKRPPPYFRVVRNTLNEERGWELAKGIVQGKEKKMVVFGVHLSASIVVASLFCANSEGNFHPNMCSNAARSHPRDHTVRCGRIDGW